jgi:hypothetical protein
MNSAAGRDGMNHFAQEEEPQFHNPKQYVTAVVEIWINNFTRLRKYVLKTCDLLAPEYDCAPAVITGCHLVGVNGHGIVLGYVCKDKWPDPQQLRILQNIPAPPGITKRICFRWHDIHGFPDRWEI